jgi:hypothetical protein
LDDRLGFDFETLDWTVSNKSRERAHQESGDYHVTAHDAVRFTVALPNDARRIYTVRLWPGGNRGWCSCEAFQFQTKRGKGPCIHLWLIHLSSS